MFCTHVKLKMSLIQTGEPNSDFFCTIFQTVSDS